MISLVEDPKSPAIASSPPLAAEPVVALPSHGPDSVARHHSSMFRGIEALVVMLKAHRSLGVTQLAAALGLSKSTTHDLVAVLVALGFVVCPLFAMANQSPRFGPKGVVPSRGTPLRWIPRPIPSA